MVLVGRGLSRYWGPDRGFSVGLRLGATMATMALEIATGHADASHWGEFQADCERCVELCAPLGVVLLPYSSTPDCGGVHAWEPGRIGWGPDMVQVWVCAVCGLTDAY